MPTLALPPRSPGNTDESPSEPQYFCGVCPCAFTSVQAHMGVHVLVVHVEGSEVIPQAPSSLLGETGSVAGQELNKWLSWLAIKPRSLPVSGSPGLGSHTQTTISSFFTWIMETKLRSSWLARGTRSQKPARPTEAAMDHRTETLPLSSRVAGQDDRACPCPHLS